MWSILSDVYCLNRAGHRTERAIGEIASAWNEKMHIPHLDLIFDSTRQLDQVGSVKVSSAQPKYRTTDDMLVEIARRPENQAKEQTHRHCYIGSSFSCSCKFKQNVFI